MGYIHAFLVVIGAVGLVAAFMLALGSLSTTFLTADNPDPLLRPAHTPVEEMPTQTASTTPVEPESIPPIQAVENPSIEPHKEESETASTILTAENIYITPTIPFPILVPMVQQSVVNIFCISRFSSTKATTGSGVIIDPRGIILTNAHIAEYFLLAEHSTYPVSCTIRSGSPARAQWHARLLFFPHMWAEAHARDLLTHNPVGTGEHDYALLTITGSADTDPLPQSFPFTPFDTREGSVSPEYEVLITAYPAEFSSTASVQQGLYPTSVITTMKRLLTFASQTVDLISLGGSAVAQGGSSGGAVVNQWGYLVGLIATTSEGETTGTRDLRAVTMAHISRSLQQHTGKELAEFFSREIEVSLTEQQKTQQDTVALFVHTLQEALQ